MDNVPMDDAVRMLAAAIGTAGRARLGDSKRLSLDVPQGTILEVMNAIVVAHGELMWEFAPVRVRDGVVGARYVINFFGPGGVQVAAVLVP